MTAIIRNILAMVAGLLAGSVVNMGLVSIGPEVIPVPEGVDTSTPEGIREGMKMLAPANFVFPFLAHALGTLAGAMVAALVAASHKMKFALAIGVLFFLGGLSMVVMVGGPIWFSVLDLVVAYLPMAYVGGVMGGGKKAGGVRGR